MPNNRMAIILIIAGLLLIGIGIALGQPGIVMDKAGVICMECIGLG